MVDTEDTGRKGARGIAKDARTKFAELLRRAERNGERIRLTRRGTPIAYIVPLADGERLRRFDDMAKRMEDQSRPSPAQPDLPQMPELPELPQAPEPDVPLVDHGDETERSIAINAFKRTVKNILEDTRTLTRPEMKAKFKDDNYIGTAVRKIIGEGGEK
jgi:prevent-host-death family protein